METAALSNKTIHATFEDTYGNIWIGTHGDGLDIMCHRPKPITRMHTESRGYRISDNSVMSLSINGDSMFVGTDSKGVDMFIAGKFVGNINSGNSPLGDNAILALTKSRNGDLWIGTYGGDVMVRGKEGSFHKIDIPGSIDVRNFAENTDGSMIVATGRGPAIVYPEGRVRTIWEEKGYDTDEWLRAVLVRGNGDIWIGSFGNGIAIYDSNFKLKKRLYIAGPKLDVKSIADSMNMSHSTLYRKVKSVTGFSVAGLIRKCRARKGAELIRTGKYTVSEVAFMVGLENMGNFRQCFKEEFGVNPSELIHNIQNKKI